MWNRLPSALRFARSFRSPSGLQLRESEIRIEVPGPGSEVSATVWAPSGSSPSRGWVVLHGMTRLGRSHPELRRFATALASTGGIVLVPEIREWCELRFAPERAQDILRGAVRWLDEQPGTAPGGVVLVGFSFGAPQALIAASDQDVASHLRGVVGWGGYADLEHTFRFALTGEHQWEGLRHDLHPDPYTRWVIGANCLHLSPVAHEPEPVAEALRALASAAGEKRIDSRGPSSDPLKESLRASLPRQTRELFDHFAPPSDREPDRTASEALIADLIPRIRVAFPLLEPIPRISGIPVPVRLLHGRSDRLIPFTETLRLGRALDPGTRNLTTRITGLFSHSGEDSAGTRLARTREGFRFLQALQGVFELG